MPTSTQFLRDMEALCEELLSVATNHRGGQDPRCCLAAQVEDTTQGYLLSVRIGPDTPPDIAAAAAALHDRIKQHYRDLGQ